MPNLPNEFLNDFDDHVLAAMEAWGVPGVAVAVVRRDEVALAEGFGVRRAGGSEPVDAATVFGIGSNTKAFTATALGLLIQEGRLGWDDRVVDGLPGFQFYDPNITETITVRDLLCHRSGLATYTGDLMLYTDYSREQMIARLRYLRPTYPFRSEFGYSNLMFITAGQIILALTGQSWDEFVTQRLFEPLGMSRTTTSLRDRQALDNVATPHWRAAGRPVPHAWRAFDAMGPAGSINSTANDMAEWLRLHLRRGEHAGRRLVSEAVIDETRLPHRPVRLGLPASPAVPTQHFSIYGLGWHLMDYHGRLVVGHGGHVDGMLSRTAFLPEEGVGVAVLTNAEEHDLMSALVYHLLDGLIGAPPRDWNALLLTRRQEGLARKAAAEQAMAAARAEGTQPSLALGRYAGRYFNPILGEAEVQEQGGGLRLTVAEHPGIAGAVEHWHYDTFRCAWKEEYFESSLVAFRLDGHGRPADFRFKIREDWLDSTEFVFARQG
jgi:CubicO group peptidase (beta-lactamase class C family)